MTKELARKHDQIFVYRGRSTARATAIRRHPLEGRSHLFSGSGCDFADQIGTDRQNRPGNEVPKKRTIKETRDGTARDSRLTIREMRFHKISYASVKMLKKCLY